MMMLWEELLARLGLKREAGTRSFALNASLHSALMDLADQEQRSVAEVQSDLLTDALRRRQTHDELWQRWQKLSPREQDVTAFTCLGYTNRQIAVKLSIAEDTVKWYVRKILVKFDIRSKYVLQMHFGGWDFSKWGSEAPD
jgi:DNA-binding CsgD family transcriptional regulator